MKSWYSMENKAKKPQNLRPNNLFLNNEIEKQNLEKKTLEKKTWVNPILVCYLWHKIKVKKIVILK